MARCPECGKAFVPPLGYCSILCSDCLASSSRQTGGLSTARRGFSRSGTLIAGLGLIVPVLLGLGIHFWFVLNHLPVMEWWFFLERLPWFAPVVLLSDAPFLFLAIVLDRRSRGDRSPGGHISATVIGALAGGIATEIVVFGSLWAASGHEMMDIVFFGGIVFIPLCVAVGTGVGALAGWAAGLGGKLVRRGSRV